MVNSEIQESYQRYSGITSYKIYISNGAPGAGMTCRFIKRTFYFDVINTIKTRLAIECVGHKMGD